jgi:hypothetical protein
MGRIGALVKQRRAIKPSSPSASRAERDGRSRFACADARTSCGLRMRCGPLRPSRTPVRATSPPSDLFNPVVDHRHEVICPGATIAGARRRERLKAPTDQGQVGMMSLPLGCRLAAAFLAIGGLGMGIHRLPAASRAPSFALRMFGVLGSCHQTIPCAPRRAANRRWPRDRGRRGRRRPQPNYRR